jgi:uncharacterized protein YbjT (DUF2867 family)
MNIALTGASGFIGRHLQQALLAAGHTVRPLGRAQGVDFARPAANWAAQLQDCAVLINTVGIIAEHGRQRFDTLHHRAACTLFDACVQAGVGRVIQLSALGCEPGASSGYHRSKRAADDYLRSLPLAAAILRPSLVYGPGSASTASLMQLARLPWLPLPAGGVQTVQPVHISDLVGCVLALLATSATCLTLDVVGPQAITLADWLQAMRAALGLPPATVWPVPLPLALAALQLGRHLHPLLQPDNLRMLQASRAANPAALAQWLGRPPHPHHPALFFDASVHDEA